MVREIHVSTMGKEEADDDGVTEMGGLYEGGATAAVGNVHVRLGKGEEGTNLLDLTSVRGDVERGGTFGILTVDIGRILVVKEDEEGSVWLVGRGREGWTRFVDKKTFTHTLNQPHTIKAIDILHSLPLSSFPLPSLPPFLSTTYFSDPALMA